MRSPSGGDDHVSSALAAIGEINVIRGFNLRPEDLTTDFADGTDEAALSVREMILSRYASQSLFPRRLSRPKGVEPLAKE